MSAESVGEHRRPPASSQPRWRYRIVVGVICLAIATAAGAGWWYAKKSGPAFGPVVVISVDSLRADHLPAYGYAKVKTPSIDLLAADGVVFERAYAHSPATLPSHVSMLSGKLPFEHGVRDEIGYTIPAEVSLLPQLLRKRGFKTGGIVSSYLLRKSTGLGNAFAFFDDEMDTPSRDGAKAFRVAANWIDSIGTARFFLFLHFDEPSAPHAAPPRVGKVAPYDGEVALADELVGKVIRHLKNRGLYDGAVIVLTADHGESLGDHGEREHGLLLNDSVLRVPLIIKLPRSDSAGTRAVSPVQHLDLMPTILDLMGAPRPWGLRGQSLRPLLDSPDTTWLDRQFYAESMAGRLRFGWSGLTSLTEARFRLTRGARSQLFDLPQDAGEKNDLAAGQASVVEKMNAALDKRTNAVPLAAPAAVAAEDVQPLAALGFVARRSAFRADIPVEQQADARDRVAVFETCRDAARLAGGGRTDEAIAAYRDAVKLDPSATDAWEPLVDLLIARARFVDAADAVTSLATVYRDSARTDDFDRLMATMVGDTPTAERYALALKVWTTLGDKARVTDLRAAARKAVGDVALRKAEAALKR